jgi:hypothetical protein
MTPAEVAEAFVAHLTLQPAAVRLQVRYWLEQYMPIDALMHASAVDDGTRSADSPHADFAVLATSLFDQLARVPGDLRLRGQAALVPTTQTLHPRPVFVLSWSPNDLVLSDELLLRAGWPHLIDALGAMCAAPEHYWVHVAAGDMRGHVVAEMFRWPELIARHYRGIYYLLYACAFLLQQHGDACAAAGFDAAAAHAPSMALRETLARALETTPPLPPSRRFDDGLRAACVRLLRNSLKDAETVRAALATALANLDQDALAAYAELQRHVTTA